VDFVAVVPAHMISHVDVGGTVRLMGRWDVDLLLDTIERTK